MEHRSWRTQQTQRRRWLTDHEHLPRPPQTASTKACSPDFPSFIPLEIYPPIANTCSLREILEFQNTQLVQTLCILCIEVEESESRGKISTFHHFIRQTRLFAAKGYFFQQNKNRRLFESRASANTREHWEYVRSLSWHYVQTRQYVGMGNWAQQTGYHTRV